MSAADSELVKLRLDLAQLADSSLTLPERAAAILQQLGRVLTFDAGWLAVHDPERHRHVPLAATGAVAPLHEYFGRPEADVEVEMLGLNRRRPPMLASEIPTPLDEVHAWADHLLPGGFREGLAAGLFTSKGRHVGFLSLLSADPSRPSHADRRVVAAVTTVIADDLDRARDIAETAQIVRSAFAGVVLTQAGDVLPLPGLPDSRRLAPGSPILIAAAHELAAGSVHISFLAPVSEQRCESDLVRVVALDVDRREIDHLCAAVLLCPPGDLEGLTVFDLRVLGLLIEGCTDRSVLARVLGVSEQSVAGSLARSVVAFKTSDVTVVAVRAVRGGMFIPPALSSSL